MPSNQPAIRLFNRQRAIAVKVPGLCEFAQYALQKCVRLSGRKPDALTTLRELSVILVSDRRMAELHRRFLQQPGPTDVITFQHGEIFISTETARSHARRFGTTIEYELRLYIAHGLLHLRGFDDKTPDAAAVMRRAQEKLVNEFGGASAPPVNATARRRS